MPLLVPAQKLKRVLVQGYVLDSLGAAPLANAAVQLYRVIDDSLELQMESVSNGSGQFQFELLVEDTVLVVPGRFPLNAVKSGYEFSSVDMPARATKTAMYEVLRGNVYMQKKRRQPLAYLDRADSVRIAGSVKDSLGTGIGGIKVRFFLNDSLIAEHTTLENGGFISKPIWLTPGQTRQVRAVMTYKETDYRQGLTTMSGPVFLELKDGRRFRDAEPVMEFSAVLTPLKGGVRLVPK